MHAPQNVVWSILRCLPCFLANGFRHRNYHSLVQEIARKFSVVHSPCKLVSSCCSMEQWFYRSLQKCFFFKQKNFFFEKSGLSCFYFLFFIIFFNNFIFVFTSKYEHNTCQTYFSITAKVCIISTSLILIIFLQDINFNRS